MTDPDQQISTPEARKPSRKKLFTVLGVLGGLALIVLGAFGVRYFVWWSESNKSIEAVAAGDFPKAVVEAKSALQVMSFMPDPKAVETNLRLLTSIYACRRQFGPSMSYNKELITFAQKTWGSNSPEYAWALSDMALAYRKLGMFRQSEELYSQVIRIYKGVPGHEMDLARTQALYAWVLCKQNKFEEALSAIKQADELMKPLVPEDSFERLPAIIEGAYISKALGKTTEFYADLASAYKICTEPQDLEKSSAPTVVVLNLLAQLLEDAAEFEHAAKTYSIAVKNCESSTFGGQYNTFMCDILDPQAILLRRLNKVPQAEFAEARSKEVRQIKDPI